MSCPVRETCAKLVEMLLSFVSRSRLLLGNIFHFACGLVGNPTWLLKNICLLPFQRQARDDQPCFAASMLV